MSFGIVAGVAGAALGYMGASAQADAAKDAAGMSSDATKYATDVQKQQYDQTRQDQEPWRQTGQSSLNMLANYMGVSNPYAQYYGMSDDELRAALLPKYGGGQSGQPTGQGSAPAAQISGNALARAAIGNFGQWDANMDNYTAPAPTADRSGIDETGLSAEMQRIRAGLTGYDPNSADRGSLMKNFSMADYQADPGYAFRMSEGMKALERSAAARGGLLSGSTLKGIQRYGQDLASQEYGNAYNRYNSNQQNQYNRLASLAGVGQTANNALSTAGSNYANNVGNLTMQNAANQGNAALVAGQARASSYGGIGNALGNVNWGGMFGGSSTPNTGFGYGEPSDWGVGAYNN